MRKLFPIALMLAVALVAGCNDSHSIASDSFTPGANATQVARAAGGPGSTDATSCNTPYGDPPAEVSTIASGNGAGALGEIINLFNVCATDFANGSTLHWTDRTGDKRSACLVVPPNASTATKLPLVVFLQGSLFPAPIQLSQVLSNLAAVTQTADLTGDPERTGFILLAPIGRNTHHYYPFPDNYALGYDNWYRNLDRSTDSVNLDVAAIDHFIAQVEQQGRVDSSRVYMMGWSNGGAMAELYALNTPSIAAAAVYSAPDPYKDVDDPCFQTPFATTLTPIMDVHNACDIIGTCQTSSAFHQQLGALYPDLQQKVVILGNNKPLSELVPNLLQTVSSLPRSLQNGSVATDLIQNLDTLTLNKVPLEYNGDPGQVCDASCASQSFVVGNPLGEVNHIVWPQNETKDMFKWLREHPLSARH